ncbi:MAG: PorV/PorQ family protein [bacterium]|nr:PorV/PorQ family protein [bacterium]
MDKIKFKLSALLILSAFPGAVLFSGGETGFMEFLRLSPSPRASAMGNSYTSVLGNSDTVFYNPGTMAFSKLRTRFFSDTPEPFVRNISFSFSYAQWLRSLDYVMFSSLYDLNKVGMVGIGLTALIYDDVAETVGGGPDGYSFTGRVFSSGDYLLTGTYAQMIGENIGAGCNIKFAVENSGQSTVSCLAFDLGVRFHLKQSRWSAGFAVLNAGPSVKDGEREFDLPLGFKLGGSYVFSILNHGFGIQDILITGDLGKRDGSPWSLGAGLEYGLNKILFLRTGYQYQGAEPGWKIGAGIRYQVLCIDYAYTPLEDLGSIHKMGISYQFNLKRQDYEITEDEITEELTERGVEITIGDIIFDINKATLRPRFVRILDKAVEILKEYKNCTILVEGHTDNIGTVEWNKELSVQRARTVYDYLIRKKIERKNLSYAGYGASKPRLDNNTEEGRRKNRRVNIVVVRKPAGKETVR